MPKNIVVVGGGNGSSVVLRALKPYAVDGSIALSAVISVADSGRTSGRVRKEWNMIPPSDVMRASLALSPHDYSTLRSVFFENRFPATSPMAGHNLGTAILGWAKQSGEDVLTALQNFQTLLDCTGAAYPVTTDMVDLCVTLSNGETICGEGEIDEPSYDRSLMIHSAALKPRGTILPAAKEAIVPADAIIMGPSSIYTSIISTVFVGGVREAIEKSSAKIIFVPQTFLDIKGETGPTTLSGMVKALEEYLPRPIDTVVVDSHALQGPDPRLQEYPKDAENLTANCIMENLSDRKERMNLKRLGAILMNIIT